MKIIAKLQLHFYGYQTNIPPSQKDNLAFNSTMWVVAKMALSWFYLWRRCAIFSKTESSFSLGLSHRLQPLY